VFTKVLNQSESSDYTTTAAEIRRDGKSAYVSQPIDVTHTGTYQLIFGPVSDLDVARLAQAGGAVGTSEAGDVTFDGNTDHTPTSFVGTDGKPYLRLNLVVTSVRAEYDDYVVLIQY